MSEDKNRSEIISTDDGLYNKAVGRENIDNRGESDFSEATAYSDLPSHKNSGYDENLDDDLSKKRDMRRLNFLVVDDNKHMRALVKGILHSFGSKNIHDASDGVEALKELKVFPADIIITDWMMDNLDGLEFTRVVRKGKDSPNPFVAIILLTGHTEMSRIVEARDAGVNEVLAKPISAQSLLSRIKEIVEKPRPFIKTKTYFGPDRRRRRIDYKGHERRKNMPGFGKVIPKPSPAPEPIDSGLSEEEIKVLLGKEGKQ